MSFPRFRRRPLGALLALAGLGLVFIAGPALAAAARIERPVTDATSPAAPSVRVIPVTPTDNPMREIAPGVYDGIVPVRMPDGSWLVDLDERFHSFSVVRRGEGHRLVGACVHGASGLARWQKAIAPTVTGPRTVQVTKWEDR